MNNCKHFVDDGAKDLFGAGADIVKIGIGPG
jgi:hypothetical protein